MESQSRVRAVFPTQTDKKIKKKLTISGRSTDLNKGTRIKSLKLFEGESKKLFKIASPDIEKKESQHGGGGFKVLPSLEKGEKDDSRSSGHQLPCKKAS